METDKRAHIREVLSSSQVVSGTTRQGKAFLGRLVDVTEASFGVKADDPEPVTIRVEDVELILKMA